MIRRTNSKDDPNRNSQLPDGAVSFDVCGSYDTVGVSTHVEAPDAGWASGLMRLGIHERTPGRSRSCYAYFTRAELSELIDHLTTVRDAM